MWVCLLADLGWSVRGFCSGFVVKFGFVCGFVDFVVSWICVVVCAWFRCFAVGFGF